MRKPCVVIDIDNTLVDTAIRKSSLLKERFSINASIEQIRDDYELVKILGVDTEVRKKFFEIFHEPETNLKYSAPLFPKSKEVIDNISNQGITIIYLTARPENFIDVTTAELSKLGIETTISNMFFRPTEMTLSEAGQFKENALKKLAQNYYIIAAIGDRPDDIEAAAKNHIPTILFTSTMQPSQILNTSVENPAGHQICSDWSEIDQAIKMYISGNEEIKKFRSQMIDLYSKWLGEIDNKLRVSVSIASIISALSGKILLDSSQNFAKTTKGLLSIILLLVMLLIFVFSLIALVYALRSLTSRFTSGKKSGRAVRVKINQGFAILFGQTKNEKLPGDAIDDLENFKDFDNAKKSTSHRTFFYKQYNSYDPDILWNFRFFSVRAANYSKLYGERFSSFFLILSILMLGLWVVTNIAVEILKSYFPCIN